MRLLVLGGTRFLGRALVESALARGDELTLFNRGLTNPELFPEVEQIRGDRTIDLSPLVGRYVFVSSVSAYADLSAPAVEGAPLAELDDRDASSRRCS